MVRYLVAVDEHDCSQRAVEKVLLLAKPKDVVYLLHVDHKKTPDLESAKQHYDDAEMVRRIAVRFIQSERVDREVQQTI